MNEKLRPIDETRDTSHTQKVTHDTIAQRGVSEVNPDSTSLVQASQERKLKVYLGIDPTSPELHIGHSVPLRKLSQFQQLGHKVHLLFGTFTGMIGDPTDKTATRTTLSEAEVRENVRTYVEQAGTILDLSKNADNPVAIVHNHEWLAQLSFAEVLELASNFTVQQLEKRAMFQQRRADNKPIWFHEFLYPLMQAYDAVALGVDVEVGGKDQLFNMMVGRDLVKRYLDKEKWCVAGHLVSGTDGEKMGKSSGNFINIFDLPEVKYEAVMNWSDESMPLNLELLTRVPMEVVGQFRRALEEGTVHPMDLKQALAFRVVAEIDGIDEAKFAEEEFDRVIRKKGIPRRMEEVQVGAQTSIAEILVISGLASDIDQAHALLTQQAIRVNGEIVKKRDTKLNQSGSVVQIGTRTIRNAKRIKF